MTLKFDGWPCKTIGHLFYATSSFVHHFVPIGEFKLKLQSGNAQFRSKSTIFLAVRPKIFTDDPQQGKSEGFDSCDQPSNLKLDSNRQFFRPCDREIWWMTLQNNRAPSMLLQAMCIISYPLVNSNLSYSPETLNSGQNRQFFELCDLEILRMTLKSNRAPLLCYFKLCASFRTHWWIQTWVTVRKRPIWVKFGDF